jgi:hypothetical protein
VAGEEGADFYIVYVHPRGAGNPLLPAEPPPECAE